MFPYIGNTGIPGNENKWGIMTSKMLECKAHTYPGKYSIDKRKNLSRLPADFDLAHSPNACGVPKCTFYRLAINQS